jgi:hypothetical protein
MSHCRPIPRQFTNQPKTASAAATDPLCRQRARLYAGKFKVLPAAVDLYFLIQILRDLQSLFDYHKAGRALTIDLIGTLSDFDDVTVRISDVTADLAVLGYRFGDEFGSSTFP